MYEAVTFVGELKLQDAHLYWEENNGRHLKDREVYQGNVLPANDELYKVALPDEVKYQVDSTSLRLTLPPRSTTILSGFSMNLPHEYFNFYILMPDGSRQYLGSDIPLKTYNKRGDREYSLRGPLSKDRIVFDVR